DLLVAGDRAPGGAGDPVAGLSRRPGSGARLGDLVHAQHALRRPALRLARSAHLVRERRGMSLATVPLAIGRQHTSRVSTVLALARRNPRMVIGGTLVVAWLLIALLAPFVARVDPIKVVPSDSLSPPGAKHSLGTDDLG